jgi:predicted lipoprotein with Yx(FWY)xxD motif
MMQNYGIKANNAAQTNAGMFSLAGGAMKMLPFSDRRTKTDIKPIGADLAGVPLYTFKYWGNDMSTHVGVMADEAKVLHPDAVHQIDGFDHVDYAVLSRRHAA